MHSTRIKLQKMPNTRDLGGIVNKNGLVIKKHKLIRSGRLYDASDSDLEKLYKEYDVRSIVDFREYEEISEKPDKVFGNMKYTHLKAMVESNALAQDERAKQRRHQYIKDTEAAFGEAPRKAIGHMKSFYMDMVNDFTVKQYGKFIHSLIKENHATLWHCSLGKDRAGIGAALVLKLLDVDDETIIEDYLYSTKCLYKDETPMGSLDSYFEYAFKEYVDALYTEIKNYYGSFDKMLEKMGITKQDIIKLQDKYLEKGVCIKSEIAPLRKVMLYRPNKELLSLNDTNKDEFLFDELPNLQLAQKEYDEFVKILKDNNVEVCYVDDLMVETLNQNEMVRTRLINKLTNNLDVRKTLMNIKDNRKLVNTIISGIKVNNKYVVKPLVNLYFQRDPQMIIGNTVNLCKMANDIRKKDNILAEMIFKYHKDYKNTQIIKSKYRLEGGDILNINESTLMIGISQRSDIKAIEELYNNLNDSQIETIIGIKIPNQRASMHLDTMITHVDTNKFVIYKEGFKDCDIYIIDKNGINKTEMSLKDVLMKYLNLKTIKFINCDDANEQWNDGTNTLTLKPGKIIVYKINSKVNQKLKDSGIEIIELKADELGRGRGGPHCMSQPLLRY